MKHVPIAEFKDRLSEFVTAAQSGEEITITRHGRDVARLVAPERNMAARRRDVIEDMARFRDEQAPKGVAVSHSDILEWIAEGRRLRDDRP